MPTLARTLECAGAKMAAPAVARAEALVVAQAVAAGGGASSRASSRASGVRKSVLQFGVGRQTPVAIVGRYEYDVWGYAS